MTDQPTPPSSLEEARDIATLDAEWWEAHNHLYRERRIHPVDASETRKKMERARIAMNAAIRAAARAEVIREVEAVVAGLLEHHIDYVAAKMYAWGVDAMYEHDCSLGDDLCPVEAVDAAGVGETMGGDDVLDALTERVMARLRALSQGGEAERSK